MSQSKRSFDRMIIPAPCDADWDSMIGNERMRFCEHCNLQVTNLSNLTRQEAVRLVARSEGRLCVRFVRRSDGSIAAKQSEKKLHQISRRVSRLAAGAFSATLSLTTAAAQTTNSQPRAGTVAEAIAPQVGIGSSVSGVISDPQGALISGATVTLTSKDGSLFTFTTGDDGMYKFSLLPAGTYGLTVDAASFPSTSLDDIKLADASERSINVELKLPEVVEQVEVQSNTEVVQFSGGAIAFIEPESPLVKAVFHEDLEAVKELAFVALDLNEPDKNTHMTALDQAVENGNLEIVRTLVLAGAATDVKDRSGRTALMYLRDNATGKLVRELISAGAKVNARDESDGTALMNAASECNSEVVKELIDAGAKVDFKDADGKTALMFAAGNSDSKIAKLLIDAGAEINVKDQEGKSALMIAADEGDPETVKLLLSFNADVNAVDNAGKTAMMYISQTSDLESAVALLNAGADLSLRDKEGKTALTYAKERPQPDMIKLLESRGAPD